MLFLFSCSSAKDALQGKKRSENSDEFLVEKKIMTNNICKISFMLNLNIFISSHDKEN